MNILITGATGFLGAKLVTKLLEDGHQVYALVRNERKFSALLEKIEKTYRGHLFPVKGDLTEEYLGIDPSVRQPLIGKLDAVYHTAAILSFDERQREQSFAMNVEGTRRALDLAKLVQAKKFIQVSTAYTLGKRTEGVEALYPLDSVFTNSYEESKCHAEHVAMSYLDFFDVMIMRPAIIIGDSNTGEADTAFGLYGILRTLEVLKKRAAKKMSHDQTVFHLLMDQEATSNIVPVDYVAKVLALGLHHGESGGIYNIINPAPPTNQEVLEVAKQVLDFDAVQIWPYEKKTDLSFVEQKLNEPLEVFKDYLNRSIAFDDRHTRELLHKNGEGAFQMDLDMLKRIIRGFHHRRMKQSNEGLIRA
ncbi:SDR family NAD(P)-dependent oxidoreductase [Bacillus xiapuensis]|uniref:SDR family NAD(P)-dependent oxidoreductase n=1 Tax=Bacillus xiapuensis TaxID=2014075 RepID=UPI000C24E209|nr:SDR family NAD(P)-dependent oxidoreductase [Bacillus xiapuensis]